jgi:exo-1,4-beta-D-glucosaminidase
MKRALVSVCALILGYAFARPAAGATLPLAEGWTLQSSAKVKDKGEAISLPSFKPDGWYPITVPSTVVAGLVKNKVLPDPYFGMNIREYPGMTYPRGKNFSKYDMAPDSPYAVPWWYRKSFSLPTAFTGKRVWAHFTGINYRANIYVNGKRVADEKDVAGALRTYALDITDAVKAGENVLAVEVWAPLQNQLAITFVDWNPAPPDKSMGLWREVYLSTSGPVALRYPTVISTVTDADGPASRADLTVTALVENATAEPVKAKLRGRMGNLRFEQEVQLAANERKDVVFEPAAFPQLAVKKPRLWWPKQMGTPFLHDLTMTVDVGGKSSDEVTRKVGIRQIDSSLDANKKRLFTVNGKRLLIRGAGWSSDLLLTYDPARIESQLKYVEDIGLNTVRLEGKLETEHFFDLADRMGLLVMAGWCCCDHWEHWDKWQPSDHVVAEQSLRSQIYRLRAHPSLLMWLNGSDFHPAPAVEQMYLRVEKELRWPNPIISSATAKPSEVSGESGVKMSGPYEWIAPSYWMTDKTRGGAHGFNSETSPGPAPPPIESLRRMFPADKLWPQNDVWSFHAGGDVFTDLKVFTTALDARYGKANTVEDFAQKSQLAAYEGIRAMFEAYSRNKYTSTGVIQWMLNNAWPGLIWHLFDYYLLPGAGYFGAKNAVEAIHPIYSYDDGSIWVVNSTYAEKKGLSVKAQVLNLDLSEKFSKTAPLDLAADASQKVLELPKVTEVAGLGLSPTYFVRLSVSDAAGKQVGSNFYWLSTKPDTFDWEKSDWFHTPSKTYADFTALQSLPPAELASKSTTVRKGADSVTTVTLANPGKSLAFFVRLKVTRGKGGEEVVPVRWQDNYVSLLPGEKRTLTATYPTKELGGAAPVIELSGPNLQAPAPAAQK